MTEQELIEMAQNRPWELAHLSIENKKNITGKVIDCLTYDASEIVKRIFVGVDEELLTKERILRFLPYDTGIYKVVPPNLKNDKDILEVIAERFFRMPYCLFDNEEAIRYVLNKWNSNSNTWAVYDVNTNYLVIKTNDKYLPYVIYCRTVNVGAFDPKFFESLELDNLEPEDVAMKIANNIIHITQCHPFGFKKHI